MKPHPQPHQGHRVGEGPMDRVGNLVGALREFLRGALEGGGYAPCASRLVSEGHQRLSAQEVYLRQLKQRYSRITRCC
jgi:hypothetical protein